MLGHMATEEAFLTDETTIAPPRVQCGAFGIGSKSNPGTSEGRMTYSDSVTTVLQLREMMESFVSEREWEPFHDPKNLSASIAIEAAELMEHFQWLRSEELESVKQDDTKMAEIREEIADVLAYTLSFASTLGIDLSAALADKMIKNAEKYPADAFRGKFRRDNS